MAWTPATFRTRWPEFAATSDDQVQAALDESLRRHDVSRWGERLDDAVGLRAAHILATTMYGQPARLIPKGGDQYTPDTTYLREWMRMSREVFGGMWAVGVYP